MTSRKPLAFLMVVTVLPLASARLAGQSPPPTSPSAVSGFRDFAAEAKIEEQFLAVPDAKLAGEELKTLTHEPHLAATPEDYETVQYVAEKFRAAGLETQIVPYRVLMNWPKKVEVTAYAADGKLLMTGPTPEHAQGDPTARARVW